MNAMKVNKSKIEEDGLHPDYILESKRRQISVLELAVLYIRVSTNKREQDMSFEAQLEMLSKKAKEKGFVIYKVYKERFTGTHINGRIEFDRMTEEAAQNKYSAIFFKDSSRLARNTEVASMLKRIAIENDIRLYSLAEGDEIEKNNLMYNFTAITNEAYSLDLSNKIKRAFLHKAEKGQFTRSEAPYGYHVVNHKLIINDDETPNVVRLIHKLYQEGHGCLKISYILNELGYDSPSVKKGKKNNFHLWGESSVRYILTNRAYIGDLVQHKEEKISIYTERRKMIDNPVIVKNTHEAIISEDCFQLTQLQMKKRTSNQRVTPKSRLFSDVLICPSCGSKLWYRSYGNRYICGNYAKYGKSSCTSHAIKEDVLIDVIKGDFFSLLSVKKSETFIDAELSKKLKQKKYKNKQEYEMLVQKKSRLDDSRGSLLLSKISGEITEEEYYLAKKSLEKQLENIEIKLKTTNTERTSYDTEEMKRKLKFLAVGIDEDSEVNREFVNRFIDKIVVHEENKIEIHYSFMEG